ncbi:class II fructose-1,6-bisphosphate aldolase [Clostridium sediminicola]
MLVTGRKILLDAHNNNYAVGAFNVNNLEFCKAVVKGAEELSSPVILQVSQGAIKYAGVEELAAIVSTIAKKIRIPIALHLDHGTDFNIIMKCLRCGFTSIMFDGSKYEFAENIKRTKQIVDICHGMGVSVEGELGKIAGTEDEVSIKETEAMYTDVKEAERFVEETGVDYLAIAVGTAHGPYKGEPRIDFKRIEDIKNAIDVPLVLHGSSGVPEESIKKAIAKGINKFNIDTDLRKAFNEELRKFLEENSEIYDPKRILSVIDTSVSKIVKKKIRLFYSNNRI